MNKEKLNDIMNCKCLQSIIENDAKKHTREHEYCGVNTIQKANDNGEVIFECCTFYHHKKTNLKTHRTEIDRHEKNYSGIPFLYCPVCGTKSKHKIPTESFYAQFQLTQ